MPEMTNRSVVPATLRSRSSATSAAWVYGRRAAHDGAYYAVRSPKYLRRLLWAVPVGLWRLLGPVCWWVSDRAGREVMDSLLAHSIEGTMQAEKADIHQRWRHRRQRRRFILAAILFGVLLFAGRVEQAKVPSVYQPAVVAAIIISLGLLGRTKPIIDTRASQADKGLRLDEPTLSSALYSLRRPGMDLSFPEPVSRDGAGWRAVVNLGGDIPTEDILYRRDRLAAALNIPAGRLFLSRSPAHPEGTVTIWVADRPLSAMKATRWALAARGTTNVFEPVEVGTDEQGRPFTLSLMDACLVIGAAPGMGKSSAMRLLLLAAVLDDRVQALILNAKGGNAYEELAPAAATYHAGGTDEDLADMLASLHDLEADVHRRYATLRRLPPAAAPDGKVTDALACDRALGLHPVFVAVDECHLLFKHTSLGKEFHRVLEYLVRVGREAGVMVWLSTQRPDADSVPTDISSSVIYRCAFMVKNQPANDMILGPGMFRTGVRATDFALADVGRSIFIGSGPNPRYLLWGYVDRVEAQKVVARVLAARPAAAVVVDSPTVIDHLVGVWPDGHDRVHLGELTALLAHQHPELYGRMDESAIGAAVRHHGVALVPVNRRVGGVQTNRKGLRRQDVLAARR